MKIGYIRVSTTDQNTAQQEAQVAGQCYRCGNCEPARLESSTFKVKEAGI